MGTFDTVLGYTPVTGFGAFGGKGPLTGIFDSPEAQNQGLMDAQAAFIIEQLKNNREIWPKMMDQLAANNGDIKQALSVLSAQYPEIIGKVVEGARQYQDIADQASMGVSGAAEAAQQFARDFSSGAGGIRTDQGALFNQLSSDLTGAKGQISGFTLPPEAIAMLDEIKRGQIEGLQTGADKLVGNAVADLSRRGMLSSSTSEGTFRGINESLAPYMAQIQAEDANRRLTLPGQMAAQSAGLSKDIFGAGTTTAGVDANLLNAIFNANLTGANAKSTAAKDVMGIQGGANQNTTTQNMNALNLHKDLFNTSTNANQLQLSPWMQLYGATAGAGSANTAQPQYPAPSPFMQILPSVAGAAGAYFGAL